MASWQIKATIYGRFDGHGVLTHQQGRGGQTIAVTLPVCSDKQHAVDRVGRVHIEQCPFFVFILQCSCERMDAQGSAYHIDVVDRICVHANGIVDRTARDWFRITFVFSLEFHIDVRSP